MSEHRHIQRFDWKRYLGTAAALAVVAILIAGASSHAPGSLSPEVKFTDASRSGLQIVPASCPSDPHYVGDCVTSCDNGLDISQYPSCNCPTGQTQSGSICSCPSGTSWNGSSCVATTVGLTCGTCPNGYTLSGSTCMPNTSQSFKTPGSSTFSVPSDNPALTVTVNGAGGGGGGGALYPWWSFGADGSPGQSSSFNTNLIGGGGGGGGGGTASTGAAGTQGSGSGGTVTTGGGSGGGAGGAGYSAGGGASGGNGGNGGETESSYAAGTFSAKQNISIVVGAGGSGGAGGYDSLGTTDGGTGGNGSVQVNWATTLTDQPDSCTCPSGYTLQSGQCVFSQCLAGEFLENGSCVSTCGAGYTQNGSQCNFTGCPTGYTQSGNQCNFTGCPTGYTQSGNLCNFSACPSGYTEVIQNGIEQCQAISCSAGFVCGLDGNVYHEDASCNLTLSQVCQFGCQNGACIIPSSPFGDIVAAPSVVKSGSTSSISWSAASVSSCTISGSNGDGWSCSGGACNATSTETSSAIRSQTNYTLSCQGLDGSTLISHATVSIVPVFQEQ